MLGRGREAGWAFKASALGLRDSRIDSGIPGLRDRLQDSRPPSDSRTPGLRDRLRDSRVPGFQDSRTSKNIAFSKVFQGFGVGPARRPEGAKTLVFLSFFIVSVARGAWAPGRAQGPREAWSLLEGAKTFIFLCFFIVFEAWGSLGNQKTLLFHCFFKVLEGEGREGEKTKKKLIVSATA